VGINLQVRNLSPQFSANLDLLHLPFGIAQLTGVLAECFQQNTLQRAADYDMKTQDNKGRLLQNFCRKVNKTELKNREVEGAFSAEFFLLLFSGVFLFFISFVHTLASFIYIQNKKSLLQTCF
jgi:hypothetical protein